jgi:hypothetical protein
MRFLLALFVACALGAASAPGVAYAGAGDGTATPGPAPEVDPQTGDQNIDQILGLIVAHGYDELASRTVLREQPCVATDDPACPAGVAPGTLLTVFYYNTCESNFVVRQSLTAVELAGLYRDALGPGAESSIYAVVFGGVPGIVGANPGPGYSIIVTPGRVPAADAEATVFYLDQLTNIIGVDAGCTPRAAADLLRADFPDPVFVLHPPGTNPSPPEGGAPSSPPFAGTPGPRIDAPTTGPVAFPDTGFGARSSGSGTEPGAVMTLFAGAAVMAYGLRKRRRR